MSLRLPPPSIPPARLFRSLLPEQPTVPLRYRIRGAESIALRAVAIRSSDEASLVDCAADSAIDEVNRGRAVVGLIHAAVWSGPGPAFRNIDEVKQLSVDEVDALGSELLTALATICPTYTGVDILAWSGTLLKGASDPVNMHEALVLSSCVDGLGNPRLDRYWGIPLNRLLDGHWMVFSAARTLRERMTPKRKK